MSKINRFIGNFKLQRGKILITDLSLINQIKNVLRLEVGDRLELISSGDNLIFLGQINDIKKHSVTVIVTNKETSKKEDDQSRLILYCSILKKDNFELVVQKATELGVYKIVPIITERTIKQNLKLDRLNKIAQEASEQSGRCDVPIIESPKNLKDIFEEGVMEVEKIFFCDFGGNIFTDEAKKDLSHQNKALFIGPEGGFTTAEHDKALLLGWFILTLSKNVLRAETAAIVGVFTLS